MSSIIVLLYLHLLKNQIILYIFKGLILIINLIFLFFKKNVNQIKFPYDIFKVELHENFKYLLSDQIENITNATNIFFKYTFLNYEFSLKYNLIKIEYDIFFYNESQNLILPSDLVFNHELHIICHTKEIHSDISINSLANINNNNNFNCIEYFRLNEKMNFGITILKKENGEDKIDTIYLFTNEFINFHYFKYKINNRYNFIFMNKEYKKLLTKIETNMINKYNLLQISFIEPPNCYTKKEIAIINNEWYYRNIYNTYFCFCKGTLCYIKKINQKFKYKFFLSIIFKTRKLYNKTDYLLADSLNLKVREDFSHPIFEEMLKQNLPVHYMTTNEEIYINFSNNNIHNMNKFLIIYKWKYIDGDFLENYLELILRLKIVVTAFDYYSIDNLFYNIEYITYIFLGHGVPYFKKFLYNS